MKTKPLAPLALAAALVFGLASCGGVFDPSTWYIIPMRADKPTYNGRNGTFETTFIERAKFQSQEYTDVVLELPEGLDEKADIWIMPLNRYIKFHAYAKARTARYLDSRKVQFTFIGLPADTINLSDPPANAVTSEMWDYTPGAGGVYTIHDGAAVKVTGSTATVRVVVSGTATLTLDNASITLSGSASPFSLASGANCTLRLTGTNTLTTTGGAAAGVHAPEGRTLTITSSAGDGQTSGTLNAAGGHSGAGIGGDGYEMGGGSITIKGGTINATGGGYAAGIGGGAGGSSGGPGGEIRITGGTVTATGGASAAGIGGSGHGASGGNITITGGRVTAIAPASTYDPAGIGGGAQGNSGNVTITGGSGTASGQGASAKAVGPGGGGGIYDGVFTGPGGSATWPTANPYEW